MTFKKIFILLFCLTNLSTHALPTAKITLKVVDSEGKPVPNANVGVGISKPMISGIGSDEKSLSGFTNSHGLFTAKGATEPYMGFRVNKAGYYQTLGNFSDFKSVTGIIGFRKWQPWNPTIDVMLKKIRNPISMYVSSLEGKSSRDDLPIVLPEEDKLLGFDLVVKDWVVPYGQGLHSDFLFKVKLDHYGGAGDYDLSLTLKFSNPDDGIQSFFSNNQYSRDGGSALKSSHLAPIDGYQDKLVIRNHQIKDAIFKKTHREDQNYYFRVRTKRDDKGEIIEANYGKIYGFIGFSIPKNNNKSEIYFTYYLNPNLNDTNIEFSPESNLFPKPEGLRGKFRFDP